MRKVHRTAKAGVRSPPNLKKSKKGQRTKPDPLPRPLDGYHRVSWLAKDGQGVTAANAAHHAPTVNHFKVGLPPSPRSAVALRVPFFPFGAEKLRFAAVSRPLAPQASHASSSVSRQSQALRSISSPLVGSHPYPAVQKQRSKSCLSHHFSLISSKSRMPSRAAAVVFFGLSFRQLSKRLCGSCWRRVILVSFLSFLFGFTAQSF